MPKKFIYIIIAAQAILTLVHWIIYALAINFFPVLNAHHLAAFIILALLSFAFLAFEIPSHFRSNWFLRSGNIFASIWVVFIFYFLFASLAALAIYLAFPAHLPVLGGAALLAALLATTYGIINARLIKLTTITVKLPNLPEFWKNKTAIMASDLHLGQVLRKGFARKVIKLINAEDPEIVFIPGDFFDGVHTDFQGLANEFKKITAPLGIYFCSGNHEMFAGYEECESALKNAGVKILENQTTELNGLQIAGVAYSRNLIQDSLPNLKTILEKLNLNPAKPSILLKHVPLQIAEAAAAGVNLQLSGHSHRGQIWPGNYITRRYFKGFDYGLKKLNNLLVYTSSGVGTWGPPIKVSSKPEIVKITFE